MLANKLQRINEDIQRELAVLLRNIKDPRVNQGMLSITAVDTSKDLGQARIYLSVFGMQSRKEFLKGLKSASGYLRYELGRSLDLRHTPELHFVLDTSIERGAKINTILSSLDITDKKTGD